MNKAEDYKSCDLPSETINYIKEIESKLSEKVGKTIALVAYEINDDRVS